MIAIRLRHPPGHAARIPVNVNSHHLRRMSVSFQTGAHATDR